MSASSVDRQIACCVILYTSCLVGTPESVNLGNQYKETSAKTPPSFGFGENSHSFVRNTIFILLDDGEMWNGVILSLTIDSLLFMVPAGLDRCP